MKNQFLVLIWLLTTTAPLAFPSSARGETENTNGMATPFQAIANFFGDLGSAIAKPFRSTAKPLVPKTLPQAKHKPCLDAAEDILRASSSVGYGLDQKKLSAAADRIEVVNYTTTDTTWRGTVLPSTEMNLRNKTGESKTQVKSTFERTDNLSPEWTLSVEDEYPAYAGIASEDLAVVTLGDRKLTYRKEVYEANKSDIDRILDKQKDLDLAWTAHRASQKAEISSLEREAYGEQRPNETQASAFRRKQAAYFRLQDFRVAQLRESRNLGLGQSSFDKAFREIAALIAKLPTPLSEQESRYGTTKTRKTRASYVFAVNTDSTQECRLKEMRFTDSFYPSKVDSYNFATCATPSRATEAGLSQAICKSLLPLLDSNQNVGIAAGTVSVPGNGDVPVLEEATSRRSALPAR